MSPGPLAPVEVTAPRVPTGEMCGYPPCRNSTKPSHMKLRFPPNSQSKPMRGTCCRTLNHPQNYINPIQGIKGVQELLHHPRTSVLRAVTLGKRSALLKCHLKLCSTPHWLVGLSLAQPNATQCRVTQCSERL